MIFAKHFCIFCVITYNTKNHTRKGFLVKMTQNVKHFNHQLNKKAETNDFRHNADDDCLIS